MTAESATKAYLTSLLAGNRKDAIQISQGFLANGKSVRELYENVIKPALYEVGILWEENKISIASEHLATAITEGILNSIYSNIIPETYIGKKAVLLCAENEQHQVGIKMVADIFEMQGWESFFLGAGFPTSELIDFIQDNKPDIVAISLSIYFNFKALKTTVESLNHAFPNTQILIGGQALSRFNEKDFDDWNNVVFIADLHKLEKYISTFK